MTTSPILISSPALSASDGGQWLVVCAHDTGTGTVGTAFVVDLENDVLQLDGLTQRVAEMPSLFLGESASIHMIRPNGTTWTLDVPPVAVVYRY